MLPEAFLNRIKKQEYIDSQSLTGALDQPSPVSVRINHGKWNLTPESSGRVPWCNDGFYLSGRPSYTLDPLFHAGCYYPQEASSMFVGEAFSQLVKGEQDLRVLDLCAAPGGKSTHLSTLIGNRGFLVANEVIKPRAAVLAENLVKWGLANWIVTRSDPSSFARLEGFFDVILVDAPCSGEGMFRDETARNEWSVDNANLCSVRQRRILLDIWPALKENGLLIYSTCTFNPEENEKNIKWLIEKESAQNLKLDIANFKGIKEIETEGISGYGFHPGRIMGEGFFLSILRKTSMASSKHLSRKENKLKPPVHIDKRFIREWTRADESNIFSNGSEVWSLPCTLETFSQLASALEIVKPGTAIFEMKGRDVVNPAHDLAMSRLMRSDIFPRLELDYENALKYLRKGTPEFSNIDGKWAVAVYKGVNLGFLKNIGNRLNNYYPTDWRIRLSTNHSENGIIEWKSQAEN